MQVRSRERFAVALAVVSSLALTAQMPAYSDGKTTAPETRSGCCSGTTVTDKNEDFTFDIPEDGCDPVRFHQARYLIEANREFIKNAIPLHEKMQEQILIAKTLKGSATTLMNQVPAVAPPKLKGPALNAAVADYTKDLQAFVNNSDRYRANLQNFRATIGECQRAQTAYNTQRNLYDLHCDQFHVQGLSNIEAPHICGALNATAGEASHIAGMLRADEQRLSKTMAELNGTGDLVRESRGLVAANLSATVTESERQKAEEKLAHQFGRLREEYEMLKIQANILGSEKKKEAGKLVRSSVSGSVVSK